MLHQCLERRWWLERPGGSSGSCSEGFGAFEGAKGQFRKPTKSLLGLHGGSLGAAPVPEEAVVVGAARRQ